MGPYAEQVQSKNTRALLFIVAALLGALLFLWRYPKSGWLGSFVLTLLVYGVVYRALVFIPDVTAYPWSLGWSEGSRYYYASLFFSNKVYGQTVPLSVLHPTRYLMQSLPFLLPEPPLWLHRLWQVLLWLGMSLLTGGLVARRFGLGWGMALFTFLFLFEGPVYYHLLVIVALMVWGTDTARFGRTMIIVILASIWAGVSRINWFPVPGLLASLLYFIEVPLQKKSWLWYFFPPALWTVVGTGVAFLTQFLYIQFSGNPAEYFGSSFSSDLLWYRLYPNATYGPGLLFSLWRISFPLLLVILARWIPNWNRFHPLRLAGMAAILLVLLAGGVIVSVKIGGGSNLHNLDAYLVVLLFISAAFYAQKVIAEDPRPMRSQDALWVLVFFAMLFPLRDVTQLGGRLPDRDFTTAREELAQLKAWVEPAAQAGGDILFIDQRHLLTAHLIENVPLVPEYEVVFLMEMVMGNNRFYLENFVSDLKNNRFALIVSGTPRIHYQDSTYAFAEENNLWVERVTVPLLCYYQVALELPDSGMSILAPREEPCDDQGFSDGIIPLAGNH